MSSEYFDQGTTTVDKYKAKGIKFTRWNIPIIYPDNKKRLTKEQRQALPQLILDARTYGFNFIEAMMYIQKRMGRFVSMKQYKNAQQLLDSGYITDEWLRQFAKVGFALVHQELLQNSLNALHDTNRRILRVQNMDKEKPFYQEHFKFWETIEIELRRLQVEQAREVLSYSMGTPVVAQIKSMVRSELILRERQRMIDSGMDTDIADYEILKNIFQSDVEKGKLNIRQIDKNNITNSDEIVKDPNKILSDSERDLFTRQEFESNGQTTNTGDRGDNRTESNGNTNYGLPTTEQAQKELERVNKAKRNFIQ